MARTKTTKVEKKEVEKKVEATPVVEVKEEVKAEVKAEVKEEVKAPAKKPAAKKAATAEKKEVAEKKTATKTAVTEKIVLQLGFGEYTTEDIVAMCKSAYETENKTKIKNIDVYVKPEDKKAYYVVNGTVAGAVEL